MYSYTSLHVSGPCCYLLRILLASTFGMASSGGVKIPLEIREAASVLREVRGQASMPSIALLHVNCEGCEWEMLENIIQAGEHRHVR